MWTQLRLFDYVSKFLYPSVIMTIIFQQELRALKYATSMIISTRRILLATDDQINKGGKLIYPGSNITSRNCYFIIFSEIDAGYAFMLM